MTFKNINSSDILFTSGIKCLRNYNKKHGHSRVKVGYIDPSGFHLYNWLRNQRQLLKNGKITPKRTKQLNSCGVFGGYLDEMYRTHIDLVIKAQRQFKTVEIRADCQIDGVAIGAWLAQMKHRARQGSVPKIWKAELEAVGVSLDKVVAKRVRRPPQREEKFAQAVELLKAFIEEFGTVRVPQKHGVYRGFNLGSWLHLQRRKWRENRLAAEKVAILQGLGVAPKN